MSSVFGALRVADLWFACIESGIILLLREVERGLRPNGDVNLQPELRAVPPQPTTTADKHSVENLGGLLLVGECDVERVPLEQSPGSYR